MNIKELPYITKTSLSNALEKNPFTLRNSITYWIENKSLIRLKRGAFVFQEFLQKKENATYYPRFLSTKMREPSYLSKEFVLQEYQMLTDIVYGYSVVTTKKTSTISNPFGVFNYQSIKKELFTGFSQKSYNNMQWFVASKAKALFDFLYFNQKKFQEISQKELDGLRLNLEQMTPKDWKEYEQYLKKAPKKMILISNLMKNDTQ